MRFGEINTEGMEAFAREQRKVASRNPVRAYANAYATALRSNIFSFLSARYVPRNS